MALRNEDLTDRELLHVVNECTAADGWATTLEIGEQLGRSEGDLQDVSSRMSWMVRYGFCERHKERPGVYRLTKAGRGLMGGKLTKAVETALGGMDEGTRLLVMRMIAMPTFANSGPAQDAMRREFGHHYSHRIKPKKRKR